MNEPANNRQSKGAFNRLEPNDK